MVKMGTSQEFPVAQWLRFYFHYRESELNFWSVN